ncbi:MAG: hypothetical protein WCC08_23140, partial [Terrimicrobiaceae bacterium]
MAQCFGDTGKDTITIGLRGRSFPVTRVRTPPGGEGRQPARGETYEYWTLCKTVRTARGPRQEVVAHLGKEPGLDSGARQGWDEVA